MLLWYKDLHCWRVFLSLTFQALISHPIQTNFLINDTQKCNKTTCIVFDTNAIYYSDRNNHYNDFLIITQINTNNIWLFNLKQNRFWFNISVIFSFLKSHCTNWNCLYIYTKYFIIIMTKQYKYQCCHYIILSKKGD